MAAKADQTKGLSIELEGGPKSPGKWRKWEKAGAEAAITFLEQALETLGYTGEFKLIGTQGLKGGPKQFIRLNRVVPERNSIELTAQLGHRESRWKYELAPPGQTDTVELFEALTRYLEEGGHESDDSDDIDEDDAPDGAEVIDLHRDRVADHDVESEDVGDEDDHATTADEAGESDHQSPIHSELSHLEEMSAVYDAAKKTFEGSTSEIDKLKLEISELQEMLRLYEDERAEANRILASEEHRTAADKIKQIKAILKL